MSKWNLWEILKDSKNLIKIQKELENSIVESEVEWLVITINWKLKVEKAEFEKLELIPWLTKSQKEKLEKVIVESINKWLLKTQEIVTEKINWQDLLNKLMK